jgi:hypothetical protein
MFIRNDLAASLNHYVSSSFHAFCYPNTFETYLRIFSTKLALTFAILFHAFILYTRKLSRNTKIQYNFNLTVN